MWKLNYLVILLISIIQVGDFVLIYPKSSNFDTEAPKDDFILANFDEPFEEDCVAEENELGHPNWYFTRDQWKRDLMNEGCKKFK